ncbi:MAG: hypothetical protein OEZ01_10285, partial [Candidatus Heimdallarchaeota archaeon]|nr:hypothetical protein [Candidatus Heimdallarchaeota archaeon]
MDNFTRSDVLFTKKSYSLRLFMLTINLFLIYLILEIQFFLSSSKFFAFITVASFLIFNIKSNWKNIIKKENLRSSHFMIIIKNYKINRKFIIISIIGLIIASIVISQSVLISSSFKQNSFEHFLKNSDKTTYRFHFDEVMNRNDVDNALNQINSSISDIFSEEQLRYNYSQAYYYLHFALLTGIYPQEDNVTYYNIMEMDTDNINEEKFNLIKSLPDIDDQLKSSNYNPLNTGIIFAPWVSSINYSSIEETSRIEVLLTPSTLLSNITHQSITIDLDWYYQMTWDDWEFLESLNLHPDLFFSLFNRLYIPVNSLFQIHDQLISYLESVSISQIVNINKLIAIHNSYIELPNLEDINLDELQIKLQRISNQLEYFRVTELEWYKFQVFHYSPLFFSIQNYQDDVGGINFTLNLMSSPLIVLCLFLVYFSLTLVEVRKSKIIATMKMRGISKTQLQTTLLSEVIIGTIIAVTMGMLFSIPWTNLSLKTSGLFEYNNEINPLRIPNYWFYKIPLISLIISFNLNISSMRTLTNTQIDEGDVSQELKAPFWQRLYLDLIFFSVAVLFWIAMRIFTFTNPVVYVAVLILGGLLSIIILLVFTPLVVSRYFADIIGIFSDILWKYVGGFTAFATKNLKKNKYSSSKLASLLMLGVMLSVIALIVPTTFFNYNENVIQYNLGSDIYIDGFNSSSEDHISILNKPEIYGFTPITKMNIHVQDVSLGIENYEILGINPIEFANIAYWDEEFDSGSLDSIVSTVVENGTMATQENILLAMNREIGEVFIISLSNIITVVLNITGDLELFPNLVRHIPNQQQIDGLELITDVPVLVNINTSINLANQFQGLVELQHAAYVKVNQGQNITKITQILEKEFSNFTDV